MESTMFFKWSDVAEGVKSFHLPWEFTKHFKYFCDCFGFGRHVGHDADTCSCRGGTTASIDDETDRSGKREWTVPTTAGALASSPTRPQQTTQT